jgi:hypothetical protein
MHLLPCARTRRVEDLRRIYVRARTHSLERGFKRNVRKGGGISVLLIFASLETSRGRPDCTQNQTAVSDTRLRLPAVLSDVH